MPVLAFISLLFAGFWSGNWKPVVIVSGLAIPMTVVSVIAPDWSTMVMTKEQAPYTAWDALKLFPVLVCGYCMGFARSRVVLGILAFGVLWGLMPLYESTTCGQSVTLGEPFCSTVFANDIRYAAWAVFGATVITFGSIAWRAKSI